jgi:hypothetical protein
MLYGCKTRDGTSVLPWRHDGTHSDRHSETTLVSATLLQGRGAATTVTRPAYYKRINYKQTRTPEASEGNETDGSISLSL